MKPKLILYLMFLSVFISCSKKETGDGLPYYQFDNNDKSKLLVSYDIGKELVYKNQDNDEIKFTVFESTTDKQLYSIGYYWGDAVSKFFYYDAQRITMSYNQYSWSNCEILLEKYPVGSDYLRQDPIIGTPEFIGFLTFPLWNGFNGEDSFSNSIKINLKSPVTSLNINGKTYPKVRIFESGKTEILQPNNNPVLLPKNVNRIYYDENYGIIGFDDLNQKNWRLQ